MSQLDSISFIYGLFKQQFETIYPLKFWKYFTWNQTLDLSIMRLHPELLGQGIPPSINTSMTVNYDQSVLCITNKSIL